MKSTPTSCLAFTFAPPGAKGTERATVENICVQPSWSRENKIFDGTIYIHYIPHILSSGWWSQELWRPCAADTRGILSGLCTSLQKAHKLFRTGRSFAWIRDLVLGSIQNPPPTQKMSASASTFRILSICRSSCSCFSCSSSESLTAS